LGEERDRVIQALALAAAGKSVSLVSSGDAGIYAMASLVYELIDHGIEPGWRRLQVEVIPGISAVQAAAARAGAPLGHDLCTISLSDLMTPWEVIENRLDHAAAADFVIGLYNPASKRRQGQFERAKEIILKHRDGETTQVIVARNLGRDDEAVALTTLAAISVDQIDMMTIVVIGSSNTRRITVGGGERVYTPRGYGDKERAK
jgi:cobalt-precorrin 5A hydrolase/precorrin-3B C17-methyltransferase